jgi:hypothetical protein
MSKGHRLQIAMYDTLVAEVVVETFREAERIRDAYVNRRHRQHLPLGCSCISAADSSRFWNVPLHSLITHSDKDSK